MESGFPDSPGYGSIVTGSKRQAAIDRRPQARNLGSAASLRNAPGVNTSPL